MSPLFITNPARSTTEFPAYFTIRCAQSVAESMATLLRCRTDERILNAAKDVYTGRGKNWDFAFGIRGKNRWARCRVSTNEVDPNSISIVMSVGIGDTTDEYVTVVPASPGAVPAAVRKLTSDLQDQFWNAG